MSNSPPPRHDKVVNRRGPYRKYFDSDSVNDSEIPCRTMRRKRKQAKAADEEMPQHIHLEEEEKEEEEDTLKTASSNILQPHHEAENVDQQMELDYMVDEASATVLENQDLEEETYSMFERQILFTSSRIDIDNNSQCNEGIDVDNVAHETEDNRYLSQPLCPCTSTNRGEAIMAVMTLGIRHSFTWVGIIDTLKTINILFARDVVPTTKYKLFKYFTTETDCFRYNIICPHCESLLGKQSKISTNEVKICTKCGMEINVAGMESFFLTASFEKQLENLLKRPDVTQNLNYKYTRPENPAGDLRDIYDGEMYRKLSTDGEPLSYPFNLSYTFNTDGCQAANSSTTALWPIYATINELPPDIRNKNIMLVGVWACKRKPNMASFLKPFVDDANELSTNGVTYEINGMGVVTSKVFAICSSVDSVARSAMLNMKQFNGYYGCTMCEHPGDLVEDKAGRKSVKYTVSTEVPADRTHEGIVRSMEAAYKITRATRKRTDVKGVFGPSPLMNLAGFDLANGLPPDSMHLVYGLMKQHTNMLLTDHGNDYYVGAPNVLDLIDRRLTALTPPKCITRTPRSLKDRALWKASEWRSWLIFYSLVCLQGILPRKYLAHLAMLSTAIQILMAESISRDELQHAHELLLKFVVLFQVYFTKRAMNYNIHLLLHVCRGVENFGPLWTHNAYPYENENRYLLQLKKSPTHLALQICRRFVMYKTINTFSNRHAVSHRVKDFCEQLSENRVQISHKISDCTLIGSGKRYFLNAEEIACLQGCKIDSCQSYEKIIYKNFRYSSTRYNRSKKNNNTAAMINNHTFVIINNICKISKASEAPEVVLFCREIEILPSPFLETTNVCVTHIKKCRAINTGPLKAYNPDSLQIASCIVMETNGGNFVSSIPRGCLGD